jgi:isocitrate dehydrogenase
MMLVHIGQTEPAERIHNAWLLAIEDGIHTGDIFRLENSTQQVNTARFVQAVIDRFDDYPRKLAPVSYAHGASLPEPQPARQITSGDKTLVGVDVFLDWHDEDGRDPARLAETLNDLKIDTLQLSVITNRGLKVWPGGHTDTFCTDHWRCRFLAPNTNEQQKPIKHEVIVQLLNKLSDEGFDFIKTENLYMFDGQRGFSEAQGA